MSVYKDYVRYPRNKIEPKPNSESYDWDLLKLTNIEESSHQGRVVLKSSESYEISDLYGSSRAPSGGESRSFLSNSFNIEHFVYETKNVKAILPSGILIQSGNEKSPDTLFEESCYMSLGFFHPELMNDRSTHWKWYIRRDAKFINYNEKLAWCYHRFYYQYFHWFIDCLPRIWLLKKFNFEFDKIFVGNINNLEFAKKSLEALGIDETSLVELDEKQNLLIKNLVFPVTKVEEQRKLRPSMGDGVHFKGGWSKTYIQDLNKAVVSRFGSRNAKKVGFDKIFVGRNDAAHRRLANTDELESLLAQKGFVFIDPGTLSFDDQVAVFHNASKIVGIHGAGMTNILWTNPDVSVDVVEIAVEGLDDPGYRMISEALTINYRVINGQPLGNHKAGIAFDDLHVNIDELEAALQDMNL
ncbi:glycosyltransferase family 61 protein [Alteromonas macleodii]|jgi:Glycosyltransferase 61|uniref:glycosyltransferase family 61 protein n=1 Tax=Alteromonas macleodii TaxID=28108 RepID=UPI00066B9C65|nr:glycosyltransferase family 61 protein [Alteromonas macleodii]CAI3967633.1 Protein of unknown function (DUF563) [Alteromonas macleodii]VTP55620.1 Protein of unknown function (DUF563) [Alteromonas macleodii]|tara:strand:+ start:1796 stop:3034 length:1239 start_codon:yes stop_codon:yes gene_type:complete